MAHAQPIGRAAQSPGGGDARPHRGHGGLSVELGRPDVRREVADAARAAAAGRAGGGGACLAVLACGPAGLCDVAAEAAAVHGAAGGVCIDFHRETFEL